jgi:hypothetical protein
LFNLLEESSAVLYFLHGPKPLVNIGSVQNRGPRLFELSLPIPKPGLLPHHKTQTVRVANRMGLGMFDLSVRVIEPALIEK